LELFGKLLRVRRFIDEAIVDLLLLEEKEEEEEKLAMGSPR
jgi:hypothetical protein